MSGKIDVVGEVTAVADGGDVAIAELSLLRAAAVVGTGHVRSSFTLALEEGGVDVELDEPLHVGPRTTLASGPWRDVKGHPLARLVRRSAVGLDDACELRGAVLRVGDRARVEGVVVERGAHDRVLRLRAEHVHVGETRSPPKPHDHAADVSAVARGARPWTLRALHWIALGLGLPLIVAGLLGHGWEASGLLALGGAMTGTGLYRWQRVRWAPFFRVDGAPILEASRRGVLRPWHGRHATWFFWTLVVAVALVGVVAGSPRGWLVGVAPGLLGLAAGLVATERRSLATLLDMARAPRGAVGDAGRRRLEGRVTERARALHAWTRAHSDPATSERYVTAEADYDGRDELEIELVGGARLRVDPAAGATWASTDRAVWSRTFGARGSELHLDERIEAGAPVVVVGELVWPSKAPPRMRGDAGHPLTILGGPVGGVASPARALAEAVAPAVALVALAGLLLVSAVR